MRHGLVRSAALAAAGLAAAAGGAIAITATERTTRVASPPPENGVPADGSSDNIAFSGDGRDAARIAFDSDASNLVPGDGNGVRDVFVLLRGSRLGKLDGTVIRASVAGRCSRSSRMRSSPSAASTSGTS